MRCLPFLRVSAGVMRVISFFAVAGLCLTGIGAVGMDENLILNGRMNADQMDMPPYWAADMATNCRLELSSGPNGLPALTFCAGASRVNAIRQNGLNLASNGVYRLSFMYKSENATFGACSIGLAADGWTLYSGVDLPAKTDGWQRFSRTVTARYSPRDGNRHFLVFYTTRLVSGTVSFADISLKPADAAAADGADFSDGAKSQREIRIVPISPRLNEISRTNRSVDFRFFGTLPQGASERDYVMSISSEGWKAASVALSRDVMKAKLPPEATGGVFTASLVPRSGGDPVFERTYEYAFEPELTFSSRGRRLNNLCTELIRKSVKAGRTTVRFGVRRRSWHFLCAPGAADLNGERIISDNTPRREAFREMEPGDYELTVHAASSGEIIVRRIAEIYNYCPCRPAAVPQPLSYDWNFQQKYVLPSVTTQCGGNPSERELAEMVRRGYRTILNQSGRDIKDDDNYLMRLRRSAGMKNPLWRGVSADELFLHESVSNSRYLKSLWRATEAEFSGKGVYTWMVGAPAAAGLDHDFIASAVNACGGRSRILYEMYMPTHATEKESADYIASRMRSTLAAYEAFIPGVIGRFGMIFGNFNQLPTISVWNHPEVDFKYYMDMQWHALATDPAFDGAGLCGYWGSYYADEELHRWSFMLTRHYVVEGRVEPLSGRYGIRFFGLIPDGDFRKGRGGWNFSDGVKVSKNPRLAAWRGLVWRDGDEGEFFAEMPAKEIGRVSKIERPVSGLIPGRLYTLQFCSFDVDKIKRADRKRSAAGAVANLGDGAEKIESLSWHNIGKTTTEYDLRRPGINVTHIIFRAKSSETVIAVTNADAASGVSIGVNAVSLCPYVATHAVKPEK